MSRSEREGDGSALRNRELAKSRFDTYWLGSIVVRTGPELLAYRILVSLLFPLALPVLALRASRQRGGFSGLIERWTGPREHPFSQDTPVLWVHAASNGEVTSARPLIEDALERDTELHVFLTTNSITAQELVATWKLPRVVTGLAPFDLRRTVGRFLDRVAPRALLVIENEIWPNRFDLCAARGIPVLLAGARMSARSGQRWTMISSVFGAMGRRLKEAVVAVAAQDAESEHRFLQWGLAPQKILPRLNLKSTVALAEVDIDTRQAFERQMSRNRTLLAASTHEGEEEVVLDAFARILATHPDARLIIAPRHPNRRADILAQVRRLGLTCASRSRGEMPRRCASLSG